MTHVTCRLTAKTGISSGTLCSVIEYGLPLPFLPTPYQYQKLIGSTIGMLSVAINVDI